jgi:hypothetical protein
MSILTTHARNALAELEHIDLDTDLDEILSTSHLRWLVFVIGREVLRIEGAGVWHRSIDPELRRSLHVADNLNLHWTAYAPTRDQLVAALRTLADHLRRLNAGTLTGAAP